MEWCRTDWRPYLFLWMQTSSKSTVIYSRQAHVIDSSCYPQYPWRSNFRRCLRLGKVPWICWAVGAGSSGVGYAPCSGELNRPFVRKWPTTAQLDIIWLTVCSKKWRTWLQLHTHKIPQQLLKLPGWPAQAPLLWRWQQPHSPACYLGHRSKPKCSRPQSASWSHSMNVASSL